ncbi:MAG: multidrug transporter substrate-binding protein [Nevskia sp.]|nr:multidrug transporter substrate-binding protein [Nevskia sp.]
MNLMRLSLADVRHRKLANSLHLLLLTLGVAIITALLLISTQISGRLERDADGIDMVIGAKGSPLQLILSTVYHLDIPTGNIPLDEANRWAHNPMVAQAIPLSLGDNTKGFRIVGTTPDLVQHYHGQLQGGRLWQQPMEAVIGAEVAKAGLKLDQPFVGVHGLGAGGHVHADHPYKVVGVLQPTGSVLDRLILTSLDSVWEIHAAHQHHHDADDHDGDHDDHDEDHDASHAEGQGAAPPMPGAAPGYDPSKEITALLIHYRSPLAAIALPRMVNSQSMLQAAVPAFETARLLQLLGLSFDTLRALAGVLIVTAALSAFVALYNAMETRQYDLAVLRSLGASRGWVVAILWIQALVLSAAGTLLGLLLGHLAVETIGRLANTARGVDLSGLVLLWEELPILLLPLVVGTVAALIPAWRAYRTDLATTLSGA